MIIFNTTNECSGCDCEYGGHECEVRMGEGDCGRLIIEEDQEDE